VVAVSRAACRLAIEDLSGACGVIHQAFRRHSRIAGDLAQSFLSLTAEIASGPFYAVFIHSRFLRLAMKLFEDEPGRRTA
jgi:hypothetical protein